MLCGLDAGKFLNPQGNGNLVVFKCGRQSVLRDHGHVRVTIRSLLPPVAVTQIV